MGVLATITLMAAKVMMSSSVGMEMTPLEVMGEITAYLEEPATTIYTFIANLVATNLVVAPVMTNFMAH